MKTKLLYNLYKDKSKQLTSIFVKTTYFIGDEHFNYLVYYRKERNEDGKHDLGINVDSHFIYLGYTIDINLLTDIEEKCRMINERIKADNTNIGERAEKMIEEVRKYRREHNVTNENDD